MRTAIALGVLLSWPIGRAEATTVLSENRSAALPVDAAFDLRVDPRGWIWVSTPAGLFRLEGARARRWGGASDSDRASLILGFDGDRVLVLDDHGKLAWLSVDQREEVPGDAGGRILAAAYGNGAIWVIQDGLLKRRRDGAWDNVPVRGAHLGRVWVLDDGKVVVATDQAVELPLAVRPAGLLPIPDAVAVAAGEAGELWIVGADGGVWNSTGEWGPERVATLPPGVTSDAVVRGATLWVAQGTRLVGVDWLGRTTVYDSADGIPGAVAVDVDREGALWLGEHGGVLRIPSPDTRIWTDRDGLPESGGLTVASLGSRTWVTSWSGPAWIAEDGHVESRPFAGAWGEACRDRAGYTWSAVRPTAEGGWVMARLDNSGVRASFPAELGDYRDCATSALGGLWLGTNLGLLRLLPDGSAIVSTGPPTPTTQVLEDQRGEVWAASRNDICHTSAASILARDAPWTCEPIDEGTWIVDIEEVDGEVWATTAEGKGILRHGAAGWTQLPAAAALPSRRLSWMSPSPRGGVWIAGHGAPLRVRPDPEAPSGWRILERLGSAQGLRTRGAGAIAEDNDGNLWVTADGVYRIPASARAASPAETPPPELVSLRIDGTAASAGGVARRGHNLVELRYAVPTGRRADELRFRLRTRDDGPWSEAGDGGEFRLVDLPAGTWSIAAQVSEVDGTWSAASEAVAVTVPPPWWRSGPALAVWVGLGVTAIAARLLIQRSVARRLDAERQRIAMDLHDEVGSGLGSLAVLAGMASEAEVGEAHRLVVAGEAARLAEELGEAIQGLVGALRRDAGAPEALVEQLRSMGRRRFPSAPPTFHLDAPRWFGGATLSLPVRRQVQLIAAEALHNAARHAEAQNVWVTVSAGRPWRLVIEDDGHGFVASARPGGGNGLPSMHARARRIGAMLAIGARPGGGTRIQLEFEPLGAR